MALATERRLYSGTTSVPANSLLSKSPTEGISFMRLLFHRTVPQCPVVSRDPDTSEEYRAGGLRPQPGRSNLLL